MVVVCVPSLSDRFYVLDETMRTLIIINMAWNSFFILMAVSEMLGLTVVHEGLPWYLKWWWIIALAAGNLVIHVVELVMLESRGLDA